MTVALRGRRQGAAAPPAPPARDCVPWNPDSMPSHDERQTHMLVGRWEPAVHDRALGSFDVRWPCAGGGKGRPRPLHPRPGRCPWPPIRCMGLPSAWRTCLRADVEQATDDRGLISMQECLQINTNGIKRSSAWHNGGMRRWIVHAASIICRGSGEQPAHPAGGAGGRARPHPASMWHTMCVNAPDFYDQSCSPTRAAARGGRAPCTPGRALPLNLSFLCSNDMPAGRRQCVIRRLAVSTCAGPARAAEGAAAPPAPPAGRCP